MADPTPAEIEACAEAQVRALYPDDDRPWPDIEEYYPLLVANAREAVTAALRAVLPDHDARLGEKIAQAIEGHIDPYATTDTCAAIARGHTTGEAGHDG